MYAGKKLRFLFLFSMLHLHFSVETNWEGPTPKLWYTTQCPTLKTIYTPNNIEKCKNDCRETQGCTALNYKQGKVCLLKECSEPVPVPTSSWSGYEGYYLKKRK